MMEVMFDRMRREAVRTQDAAGKPQLGKITAYDPSSYAVKVELQPDGYETGWMPLGAMAVGPGWGVMFGPAIGTQVKVSFQENGQEAPIADFQLFDNVNRPNAAGMAGPPSGQFWIVNKDGSYLKFTADGNVHFSATGIINVGNEAQSLHSLVIDTFESLFNNHVHTNGNDGANTGVSTTQMSSAHLTNVAKAN